MATIILRFILSLRSEPPAVGIGSESLLLLLLLARPVIGLAR